MSKSKNIGTAIAATVLGTIGFGMLFSRIFNSKAYDPEVVENEGLVQFGVLFGGGARYVNTDKLEEAKLKCRFGGMEVYFDNAELLGDKALIDVDASFGGVELYIPKKWEVVNNMRMAMGAVEYVGERDEEAEKVINLVGNVSFGAVEVHYV